MPKKILIPVSVPIWAHGPLLKLKRKLVPPAPVVKNIDGERYVEWSFLSREMPDGPGEAIDFGCENGFMSLVAAEKGFHVLAIDLQQQSFLFEHRSIEFRLGDFLRLDLPEDHFDLILNCSSVEHVGVAGRYGITASENDGDLEALQKFARVLKARGAVLMTAPCGRDAVMAPWCRVYGEQRLPRLLAPFAMEKERYWIKDDKNRWVEVARKQALDFPTRHDPANPHGCSYALGGFVLRKLAGPRS
jgi:SAM-dependent methyltransferase